MGDLVEETLQGIRARLGELAPVMAEYERLQAAYAALDGAPGEPGERRSVGGRRRGQRGAAARRARTGSGGSGARAPRSQNKAAVFGVIAQRPGVSVAEIAQVTGIAKPSIYNTTRAGVERGELERVALPSGGHGFRMGQGAPASDPAA